MASSSISPYKSNSAQVAFVLVSSSVDSATYKVAGRELACPHLIELKRKLTDGNKTGNDHVVVRIARVERNVTTNKLATFQGLLDLSIPKDQSILTAAVQLEELGLLSSILNDYTALAATTATRTALIEGRDL